LPIITNKSATVQWHKNYLCETVKLALLLSYAVLNA